MQQKRGRNQSEDDPSICFPLTDSSLRKASTDVSLAERPTYIADDNLLVYIG